MNQVDPLGLSWISKALGEAVSTVVRPAEWVVNKDAVVISVPVYVAYYSAYRVASTIGQQERRLPTPLRDVVGVPTTLALTPLVGVQVGFLGLEVGLDYVKSWTGSDESVPAEGVCGHILPFQKGPIWYLPGWEKNGQWDFSVNHPYPLSEGFSSIPSWAEGGGPVPGPRSAGAGSGTCSC